MAKHNRDTLKNYFREGALPSSIHFADLIDSTLNTLEEGFDKTAEDGLKIASLEKDDQLMSFYRESVYSEPLWSISYDQEIDSLLFKRSYSDEKTGKITYQPILTFGEQGNVGINTTKPQQALDVAGVLRTQGRMGGMFAHVPTVGEEDQPAGQAIEANIPADGNWHRITPILEGCHAFEIVAGVGIQWTGQYAMVRANAMNTCDPRGMFAWLLERLPFLNFKNRISCQHAYYRSRSDKLKLRWVEVKPGDKSPAGERVVRRYYLAIKTNTAYDPKVYIRYHITQLWFDNYMIEGEVIPDEPQ
jgi:hypothetical protein